VSDTPRTRLKFRAELIMGQSPLGDSYSSNPEDGLPFLQGTADFGIVNPVPRVFCAAPSKVASSGDLLLSVRAPVGELNIADQHTAIGRGLCAIRPHQGGRFAWWAIHEAREQLRFASTGSTYEAVSVEDVANIRVAELPSSQRERVSEYLDCEIARIDALIAAKERLLQLLAERRQAIVTHAVTRGIDPNCPMRNSGTPWLGSIPKHWKTMRIAWLFRERDQRGEPDLPLLEVSINGGVRLREFSDDRIEATAADFNTYKVARRDDVVFNKMRMWQGAVGVAREDGLVSPDYVVAAPKGTFDPQYAEMLFRTPNFSAECGRRSHGIVWDRLRLYWEEFRDISVPVPEPEEQTQIVQNISVATSKLDELSELASTTINLLKERRSALISAGVTGQIPIASETVG
jgi:type I restriction enzyme S subunit